MQSHEVQVVNENQAYLNKHKRGNNWNMILICRTNDLNHFLNKKGFVILCYLLNMN